MATSTRKIIAIAGGTGNLGSSVARSLHDNPDFHVRVLSRDPTAAKAQVLAKNGIEVVKCDNWKAGDLQRAFTGCWGVFINIDSDAPNFKNRIGPSEFEMGKIIIDAAVKSGVKHAVHASLPAASKLTNGKVPVLAFDDKAAISEYLLEPGRFQTASILSAGWFLENAFDPKYTAAFGGFATIPDAERFLTYRVPAMGNDPESVPWLAVADDYGDFVHGVFLDPERWNRQYIHGVSESASFAELTAKFQKLTGKPARHVEIPKGGLTATTASKTTEVNGLFDLMQEIKGNFFNGIPTKPEDARVLKENASKARRSDGVKARPMTIEEFFIKYAK
ncbi:NmrA domain-containing protein [Fusarium falciforme]|uniref:NmrA domain-containing protein n=1 Tax=Fusarium falciforme TaxID=195108 RepID=UPI00230065DC|nr:NmrA domain-containing protein [Fusarium falciforme]WAO92333.1 NmrA domain-containing protein [Fusarium falciforme]